MEIDIKWTDGKFVVSVQGKALRSFDSYDLALLYADDSAEQDVREKGFSGSVKSPGNRRSVMCVETGKIFPSLYQAAQTCPCTSVNGGSIWISRAAKTGCTAYGHHWEFIKKPS